MFLLWINSFFVYIKKSLYINIWRSENLSKTFIEEQTFSDYS